MNKSEKRKRDQRPGVCDGKKVTISWREKVTSEIRYGGGGGV